MRDEHSSAAVAGAQNAYRSVPVMVGHPLKHRKEASQCIGATLVKHIQESLHDLIIRKHHQSLGCGGACRISSSSNQPTP